MSRSLAETDLEALERVQRELIRRMDGQAHLPLGRAPEMTVPRERGSTLSIIVDAAGVVQRIEADAPVPLELGDDLGALHGFAYLRERLRDGARHAPLLVTSGEEMLLLVGRPHVENGIRLTRAEPIWSPQLDRLTESLFGLTQRERDVLAGLTAGLGAAEIAVEAARSEGTVRQQIKSILGKLGVRSQARAVALIGQLAALDDAAVHRTDVPTPLWDARAGCDWLRFGREGGMPVLFFHGALFGIAGTATEREAAPHVGLDIVAPVRPGYGRTPFPDTGDAAIREAIECADALLDQLGLGKVVVMAHDIGTLFAYAYAAERADRVHGLVAGPTTPPMRSWEQTAQMPPMHRVNAFAAQRFPRLMDRIVVLGMRQIARKGADSIPGFVFADSGWDRRQWEQAGVSRQAWLMAQAQDGRGFRNDMMLTNTDWSDLACRVTAPVTLFHGARSQTVSHRGVVDLLAFSQNPLSRIELVEEAGHTLPVTNPGLLLCACARTHAIAGR
ncbi:alpha/beta fold hydrolase [Roseobacter sp. HKCCA0434]|uniref:alpha/beta fold hydrolase n=1 Tax=Roseobacter sp. HKCCA0434 TaxID=3079297 RepID=UPI002905AB2E|nr:alpha/beta fold hydrolase [Roseobacter sp. HKCCA0434]